MKVVDFIKKIIYLEAIPVYMLVFKYFYFIVIIAILVKCSCRIACLVSLIPLKISLGFISQNLVN